MKPTEVYFYKYHQSEANGGGMAYALTCSHNVEAPVAQGFNEEHIFFLTIDSISNHMTEKQVTEIRDFAQYLLNQGAFRKDD